MRLPVMLALALLLLPVSPGAASVRQGDPGSCPPFPLPPKAKTEAVASQLDFNGIPMRILRLESELSTDALRKFFRERWPSREGQRGAIEYPVPGWQVVAMLQGICFYTAQIRPFGRNGSEALLGVTIPPAERPPVREALSMPPGSDMLNDLAHQDGKKTARTVMLRNGLTPQANIEFYLRTLGAEGWNVLQRTRIERADAQGEVMVLRKGQRELTLTALRAGQSSNLVLNFVDQP
jgi:hypothetical protein